MYPLFHTMLIEADERHAETLTSALTSLGAVVTRVTDPAHSSRLMSHLLPDLLMVGIHPTTVHTRYSWLPAFLAATPVQKLLYTEHPAFLDVVALTLPLPATIMRWPCSQSELAFLLAPLLGQAAHEARSAAVSSPRLLAPQSARRTVTATPTGAACSYE